MEARLRKLLSPRRHRTRRSHTTGGLDLNGVASTTTPAQAFEYQTFGKSDSIEQDTGSSSTEHLRSLSYEQTAQGRLPQLGDLPQRGNGPVKLQTSRQLSSGELMATEQDYGRTLEEILEGDYIVVGHERRTSNNSAHYKPPTDHVRTVATTVPSSPREHIASIESEWPSSRFNGSGSFLSPISITHPFTQPQPALSTQIHHSDSPLCSPRSDSFILSKPAPPFHPRHMASTTSLVESREMRSPTIEALWRAECGRLTSIYGPNGMDQQITAPNGQYNRPSIPGYPMGNQERSYSSSSSQMPLSPCYLPTPTREGLMLKTNASTSNLNRAYHDDQSDDMSSLPRLSDFSSHGTNSSFATRTSLTEEPSITRDDIRKIISDMRTNYLHAIEAHTPPLKPLPSPPIHNKPRSKKQTPSLMSYASVDGSLRSTTRLSNSRTKSWQSASTHFTTPRSSLSSPVIHSKRPSSGTNRRKSGPAVAGVATLTPIAASPAKSPGPSRTMHKQHEDAGLKRADSTTLGVLAKKLTIIDDRNSTGSSSQDTSKSSPTFYDSATSNSASDSETDATTTSPLPAVRASTSFLISTSSSVQNTPEKQKVTVQQPYRPSPIKSTWNLEVDTMLADDDLEKVLDIDDFGNLCDGLFNSSGSVGVSGQKLDLFSSWGIKDTSTTKSTATAERHDSLISQRPPELRFSKLTDKQLGLGLTGLPTMI